MLPALPESAAVSPLSPAVLSAAAPCMGSGARMFSAMPLEVAVCGCSLSVEPFSRMAVTASESSRMAAMTPASRSPVPARLRLARPCAE